MGFMKPKTPLHHKRWTLRLFEWGVLTCIILILIGVFLNKMRHLQAKAERLNVQATVENMRAAVLLAGILHQDRESVRAALRPGGNPVALLEEETGLVPARYLGELDEADPGRIAPGHWYFDRSSQSLVYRLRSVDGFASPLSGPPRIRFCLRQEGEGRTAATVLRLEACEPYNWEPPG
jgi:hypothetical protein